jgi:hypothetical protein
VGDRAIVLLRNELIEAEQRGDEWVERGRVELAPPRELDR